MQLLFLIESNYIEIKILWVLATYLLNDTENLIDSQIYPINYTGGQNLQMFILKFFSSHMSKKTCGCFAV